MDLISKKYDKVLLLVVSIIGILVGGMFLLKAFGFGGRFNPIRATERQDLGDTGLKIAQDAVAKLGQGAQWAYKEVNDGVSAPLFGSTPIIQLSTGDLVRMESTSLSAIRTDPVEVPNRWLLEHNLNFIRTDVLYLDPDGDGFSNYEEYVGQTDPRDPGEHPPFITQLKMRELGKEPYVIRFATAVGANEFQVIRIEPDRKSWFLKIGDTFPEKALTNESGEVIKGGEAGRFTVEKFTPDADGGELHVIDSVRKDGNPVVLKKAVETPRPVLYANFIYKHRVPVLLDPVYIGETFSIPTEPDKVYTLKEVNEEYAVITLPSEDGGSPQELRIPLDN